MHTPHLNLAAHIQCPLLHQALVDRGLVTAGIHQGLICTPLNTHRYLVLPGLIGGSPRGVGDPDQQSHLHHGTVVLEMPRIPASPAGRLRPYRRPRGRRMGKGLPERGRWCCCGLCPASTPGPSIPLAVATPWWGSRGRLHPWPGSWYRARERGERRRGERERERLVRGSPTPGHATIWSSASWMACVSDVGRWHWTHSAVRRGSRTMNCSSTTRSITPSTSRDSAMSHLRQASRSCWAITNGRPLSPSSTERTRSRMARLRSSWARRFASGSCWAATCASSVSSGIRRTGHWVRAQPHASAVFSNRSTKASGSLWGPILISGTWAIDGAATGVSSRPSKLRIARRSSSCAWTRSRKWSSCSSFMSMSAWCWAWWRPASDLTSSASGVDWAGCMAACRLPRPGFRHQCRRFWDQWKEDEEVRGDEPNKRGLYCDRQNPHTKSKLTTALSPFVSSVLALSPHPLANTLSCFCRTAGLF